MKVVQSAASVDETDLEGGRPSGARAQPAGPAGRWPAPTYRLLLLDEAAAYLRVSSWTVRDYVLAGLLPTVNLPALRAREGERQRGALRRLLFDVRDLDDFIDRAKAREHRL